MRASKRLVALGAGAAALALALAGCSSSSTDPTVTDPVSDVGLPPSDDTYLGGDYVIHGAETELLVDSGEGAYLKFPVADIGENDVITAVSLRLVQKADQPAAAVAMQLSLLENDGWDEETAWIRVPIDNTVLQDLGTASFDSLASGTRAVDIPLAAAVDVLNAQKLYADGLVSLRLLSRNRSLWFFSKDNGSPELAPQLLLTVKTGTRLTLFPTADTYSRNNLADPTQAPVDTLLDVNRSSSRTFLKFDLSAVPAGADLHFASLTMTAFDGYAYGGDGNVYTRLVADDGWDEGTLLNDNEPEASATASGHWWLWYDYTNVEKVGVNASPDLLPVVAAEAAGDHWLSLRLDSPGYWTRYYARTCPDESKRPTLELLYTR